MCIRIEEIRPFLKEIVKKSPTLRANIRLQSNNKPTAHCSPDVADWMDPSGGLRKAGLLVVDLPNPEPPEGDVSVHEAIKRS